MSSYYNDNDPFCAKWLRNLIAAGLIAPGDVDERDIRDVKPKDLKGYTQCHFFAGIGGWSYALRLASWPDDRPVWTGSPPCQPFSVAGKGLGKRDERHLAPVWLDLVRAVRPPVVFGEQVAAAVTKDAWLDDLLDVLESAGYTTGAAVVPACGVGAPHIRQRLWFVAERLADGQSERRNRGKDSAKKARRDGAQDCCSDGASEFLRLADSQRQQRNWRRAGQEVFELGAEQRTERLCNVAPQESVPGPIDIPWRAADWLLCRDGKWRPVEPGTFPLASGVPSRVGRLRGYGNAIVPHVAAEIIRLAKGEMNR